MSVGDMTVSRVEREIASLKAEIDQLRRFNELTPAESESVALVCEEACEIGMAAMKIERHGLERGHPEARTSNREDLEREIGNLFAAVAVAMHNGVVSWAEITSHKEAASGKRDHPLLHHAKIPPPSARRRGRPAVSDQP